MTRKTETPPRKRERMVPSFGCRVGNRCPAFSRRIGQWCAGREVGRSSKICPRGMVPSPPPKRDHGDPQSFRLRSEGKGHPVWTGMITWCGRRDLNPHGPLRSNGFSYPATAFAAPAVRVWGLDYPFTIALALGAARLVSTPSQPFRAGLGSGWQGSNRTAEPCVRLQGSRSERSRTSKIKRRLRS